MNFKYLNIYLLAIILVALQSCKKEPVALNILTANKEKVIFLKEGGSISVTIETDAAAWSIKHKLSSWLTLSASNGTEKKSVVSLSVSGKTLTARYDTLTITAGTANPVVIPVSQPSSDYLYSVSASVNSMLFKKSGASTSISIITDASQWNISADAAWIQFSQVTGSFGSTGISVTALENTGTGQRTGIITVSAANAAQYQIAVTQKGDLYPSYNTSPISSDTSGMRSTAVQLAAKIKLGWNLGNSLEATGGEIAWGNPATSKALIDLVRANGFNAIRIPCSWDQYMSNSAIAQLSATWLARVKEVIQYCVADNMYVILNIHWDGGWLESNCTTDKQEEVNSKQKAFWEQIATTMRDFDEHVMFASANEPNVTDASQMAVLISYHQTFINAVRSTGGRNTYRVLVVQGPSTDIEKTNTLMNSLPTDPTPNHLMAEIHYYTPWNFCGLSADADWGKMFYYWGSGYHSATDANRNATWGEESTVDSFMGLMKTKFVDHGIPVVMGEYAPMRRALTGDALTLHLNSRAYYLKYVTKKARENGILPFYWDSGPTTSNGSGIFDRNTNSVGDRQALDSLKAGAAK
jgi:endoglucanase